MAADYTFLVPSTFYFEVFDEPSKIRQTLVGIREFRRVDIPILMRSETRSGEPCIEIKSPPLSINPDVFRSNWKLGADETKAMDRYVAESLQPALTFLDASVDHGVPGFSAKELETVRKSTDEHFVAICEMLRDEERIRRIARTLDFPHASTFNQSWIYYRVYQALLLQGLILFRRYKNKGDVRSKRKLEHDWHDAQYLILGLHAGRLATNDVSRDLRKASMAWRFHLLEPDGVLMTP